jgi:hypothetical protein
MSNNQSKDRMVDPSIRYARPQINRDTTNTFPVMLCKQIPPFAIERVLISFQTNGNNPTTSPTTAP